MHIIVDAEAGSRGVDHVHPRIAGARRKGLRLDPAPDGRGEIVCGPRQIPVGTVRPGQPFEQGEKRGARPQQALALGPGQVGHSAPGQQELPQRLQVHARGCVGEQRPELRRHGGGGPRGRRGASPQRGGPRVARRR